ncbi:MAG: cysteine-rich CWC family protein [Gammaproteobacteria bacterium]|nr:cysteine-rich CWC family protein [Gammaproteobacteria bacterium]
MNKKSSAVNLFDPEHSLQPNPANICQQCQQSNLCDIASGSTDCWCFKLETFDVGLAQKGSTNQCLCQRCLQLIAKTP